MNFSPPFLKIQTLFFLTTITKQVHVTYTCINWFAPMIVFVWSSCGRKLTYVPLHVLL